MSFNFNEETIYIFGVSAALCLKILPLRLKIVKQLFSLWKSFRAIAYFYDYLLKKGVP